MADESTHERSRQDAYRPARVGRETSTERILMCSVHGGKQLRALHDLCSLSKHTKARSHNGLLTVVHAKISDEAVKEAY
jgi:hypothetical protein